MIHSSQYVGGSGVRASENDKMFRGFSSSFSFRWLRHVEDVKRIVCKVKLQSNCKASNLNLTAPDCFSSCWMIEIARSQQQVPRQKTNNEYKLTKTQTGSFIIILRLKKIKSQTKNYISKLSLMKFKDDFFLKNYLNYTNHKLNTI